LQTHESAKKNSKKGLVKKRTHVSRLATLRTNTPGDIYYK